MGASLSLQNHELAVDPGSSISTDLRVRNTGAVVDQISFQPLGDAAAWISVEPPTVRLFPETDTVVTITIAPPRKSSTTAGAATWAVKATPQEDPAGASVAEGTVAVGSFTDVAAELQPKSGRGRLVGRFELAIDNRGNGGVAVRVNGTDADQSLAIGIHPSQIDTEPGSAHFAKLRVRPERRIWRGQPKNHPFQIVVEPQAAVGHGPGAPLPPPIALDGNLLQEPVFPKWLMKALAAVLALLVALVVLWKALVKPSVESAAREVAIEEIAPVSSALADIQPAVTEVAQQAAAAAEQANSAQEAADSAAAGEGAGAGGGGGALDNLFNSSTQPSNSRLTVDTPIGATNSAAGAPLAEGQTFALTDLILQNPGGDVGRIRVVVDGTPILESALENFRDLDFHFVAPYIVSAGQSISIEVTCGVQIDARTTCSDAVSFSGFTTTVTPGAAG